MSDNYLTIVFCRTRAMCVEFYSWYWKDRIIPFVNRVRSDHKLNTSQAYVNCDGEQIQIEVFSQKAFQDHVETQNITVDKPSASTSATSQPLDAGKLFLITKRYLSRISDGSVEQETTRFAILSQIWKQHQEKYQYQMKSDHVRMGIWGILRVRSAFQEACTPLRIKESFKTVGQVPFCTDTILRQCSSRLTVPQETDVRAAITPLTQLFLQNGQLTEADFELHKIPQTVAVAKAREDLITSRQRTLRLTHPLIRERIYLESVLRKEKAKKKKEKIVQKKAEEAAKGGPKPTLVVRAYTPRKRQFKN